MWWSTSQNVLGGKGDASLYICDNSMADFQIRDENHGLCVCFATKYNLLQKTVEAVQTQDPAQQNYSISHRLITHTCTPRK